MQVNVNYPLPSRVEKKSEDLRKEKNKRQSSEQKKKKKKKNGLKKIVRIKGK